MLAEIFHAAYQQLCLLSIEYPVVCFHATLTNASVLLYIYKSRPCLYWLNWVEHIVTQIALQFSRVAKNVNET